MNVLCEILELLRDGEWHYVSVLQEKLKQSDFKIKLISTFLVTHDFCESKAIVLGEEMLRLKADVLSFIENLEKVE